jgi:DNA invertase Pin-like site-specific DNA recombinase
MTLDLSMQIDHRRRLDRMLEIVRQYRDGIPVIEIAEEFDCSRGTVLRLARAAGLAPRSKRLFTQVQRDEALRRFDNGEPLDHIANVLGTSVAWVSHLARDSGRPSRRPAYEIKRQQRASHSVAPPTVLGSANDA